MKVIDIILVGDDDLDIMHIKRAFDKMKIVYKLNVAKNGEEAIEVLKDEEFDKGSLPDIVLIDINMPKMNGLEFLNPIRKSELETFKILYYHYI